MKQLKIAIATICLNEEKFVDRFMSSACEADGVFVLDTGSTDNTVDELRARGAAVQVGVVKPWRFDVPRNIAHCLVPEDYDIVVSVDLDEVFTPGWVEALRAGWTPTTTRARYKYAWSHNADGSPGTTFWYDKIVQRKNYRWVKPVHEILTIYNEPEVQTYIDGFMLHHWPDSTKSRGSYLPLLELAVQEEPHDDRSAHYLGREYMYYHKYDSAINELKRHLDLPSATWKAERAASMRYISRCYGSLNNWDESFSWGMKACLEAPGEREPWVELAEQAYKFKQWDTCYYSAKQALKITERPMSYICEPGSWSEKPYDLLAIAAYQLGHKQEAYGAAKKAAELNPNDKRLARNVELIKEAINEDIRRHNIE